MKNKEFATALGGTKIKNAMRQYTHDMWIREVGVKRMMSLLVAAFLMLLVSLVVSCTALDEAPDNRTEIDSPEKVGKFLTSAYPLSVPAVICELSGDNLVDNNVCVPATHNDAFAKFHEQAYEWDDINNYSTGEDDTPYTVWESYYQGHRIISRKHTPATAISVKYTVDLVSISVTGSLWGQISIICGEIWTVCGL